MRPSRVFRLIFRIFIFLLTISVTLVSILGGLSAILILQKPEENIGLDPDNVEFIVDINNATLEIENFEFSFPFNFTNVGVFDLENFQVKMDIAINYSEVDYPAPGVNGTKVVRIYSEIQVFGKIPKGTIGDFTFTGDFADFVNLPNATLIDWNRGPPAIEIYANLTISLDYSIGLHRITIGIHDLPIGGLP